MSRYVDPRTGEPQTAYSELTQTEWALFIDDDWKVRSNFTINVGLRYENYGTFKDTDDTLRNLILGSGSTYNERLANARVDFVDKFYPTDNNNLGPRLGFAWDPEGRRQDVGSRRLRLVVRPSDEPAGRELPQQPAAARDGRPRAVLRHAAVHLQPRRSVEAVPRLPGRSGAASRSRLAQRRHRRARRAHDRRSEPASIRTRTTGSSVYSATLASASLPNSTISEAPAATSTTPTTSTAMSATCWTAPSTASTRASSRSTW